jgi:hypothetical protein
VAITHDDRTNRLEAVRALHRALIDVPGLGVNEIIDIVPLNDTPNGITWQVGIKTRVHGMVHVYEDNSGEGVRILRRSAWGGSMGTVFMSENPDVSTLTIALCHALIGRGDVPLKSRRQVRDVLNAASRNAEYTFRVGMDYILNHNDHVANWATLDEPDRWDAIEEAYVAALNLTHNGFLISFRKAGVRLQIMDIYDDAHVERARELLDTITPGKRP